MHLISTIVSGASKLKWRHYKQYREGAKIKHVHNMEVLAIKIEVSASIERAHAKMEGAHAKLEEALPIWRHHQNLEGAYYIKWKR